MQYLVEERGVDVHNEETLGYINACGEGHLPIVQYLVSRGIDIHNSDDWGFRYACQRGHLEIVKFLVSQGINEDDTNIADISSEYSEGLISACGNGHLPVVQWLTTHKTYTFNDEVNDVIYNAFIDACRNGHLSIVQYLTDTYHIIIMDTGFATACEKGHLPIVQYMVEHMGANVNLWDGDLFKIICREGHLPVVRYFVEHGVDIHANNDSAFIEACLFRQTEVVQYLQSQGVTRDPPSADMIDAFNQLFNQITHQPL